jgi:hypothetical protein
LHPTPTPPAGPRRPSGCLGGAPRADRGNLDQAVIPPHPEDHPPATDWGAVDDGGSHQPTHIPVVGQLGYGGEDPLLVREW